MKNTSCFQEKFTGQHKKTCEVLAAHDRYVDLFCRNTDLPAIALHLSSELVESHSIATIYYHLYRWDSTAII